jgi:ribonuclease P protein component
VPAGGVRLKLARRRGEPSREAHLPTQEALPAQDARVSCAHVHAWGPGCSQGAPPQGAQAADARTGSVNRRHRLRGGRAFAAVRARRAVGSASLLRVALAPNTGGLARVGLVVSRREGGAVTRNRVRRRLRALLQPHLPELGGVDVVVSARAGAGEASWQGLRKDFNGCLARARRRLDAGTTGRP